MRSVSIGLIVAFGWIVPVAGQGALELAHDLRPNAVLIVAEFDGEREVNQVTGFGMIVGQDDSGVWIATAAHTIWRDVPDRAEKMPADRVLVRYFGEAGPGVEARVSAEHFDDSRADLAFISADPPQRAEWIIPSFAPIDPRVGEPLAYLGCRLAWEPYEVRIDNIVFVEPRIEILGDVPGGVSGAPLISEAGIVGMVLSGAEALSGDYIRRAALRLGVPWSLEPPQDRCDPFEVCLHRTDSLGSSIEILGNGVGAVVADGDCTVLTPERFYGLRPVDRRLRCTPDRLTPICGMPPQVNVACAVDLAGQWRSNWGPVEIFHVLSGEYRFFGFEQGPGVVREGKVYLVDGRRAAFIDQRSSSPEDAESQIQFQRPWRAELVVELDRLSGEAQIGGERSELHLARGTEKLPEPSETSTSQSARAAAERFLKTLDEGAHAAAYELTSASFRGRMERAAFGQRAAELIGSLGGRVSDRLWVDARPMSWMPLPEQPPMLGSFYIVHFKARYQVGPVYEQVSLEMEDESWRVVGFYFYPAPE